MWISRGEGPNCAMPLVSRIPSAAILAPVGCGSIRLRSRRDLSASKAQSFRQGEYRTRNARRQKLRRNCFGGQSLRSVQNAVGRPAMAGATGGRAVSLLPLAHPLQMTTAGDGGQAAQHRWAFLGVRDHGNGVWPVGQLFGANFYRVLTRKSEVRTTLTLSRRWPILREAPCFA